MKIPDEELSRIINSFIDVPATEPNKFNKFFHALEQWGEAHAAKARLEAVEAYKKTLDVPELEDFAKGCVIEAQHQRQRWGNDHDTSKEPEDWFWLIGYLAGKGLQAQRAGNMEKFKHHLITGAAVLANWHARAIAALEQAAGNGS